MHTTIKSIKDAHNIRAISLKGAGNFIEIGVA